MNVPLYGRKWSFIVSEPNNPKALEYTSDVKKGYPLRLSFNIERTLSSSDANKAKFQLCNLTPTHRSLIAPGSTIIFRAGYGSLYDIVFRGTAAVVSTTQQGPDLITEIEAGDGEPYLQTGHVHLVYKNNVSLARVLQDICDGLQCTIAGQKFAYQGFVAQRIPRVTLGRRVISGPVKDVLNSLLTPLDISWSIQCGTLIIQASHGIISLSAQVLTPTSGLIGIPSKTKTGVSLNALLLPTISPGMAVQVKCKDKLVSGNFRIISAKYQGDTNGPNWTIEADAQVLTYPLAEYVKDTSQSSFEAAQVEQEDIEDMQDEEAMQ